MDVTTSGELRISEGALVSSGTNSQGNGGAIHAAAGSILIDARGSLSYTGITSQAGPNSTGNVVVSASERIRVDNGGSLSIRNEASVADPDSLVPTKLTVSAPIVIVSGGSITAATGGNVNASAVAVNASATLSVLHGGQIGSDTSAQGHAGTVTVRAGDVLIDGRSNAPGGTGISSNTSGSGDAGFVDIQADRNILLAHGGTISTDTFSSGTVSAASAIFSNAYETSSGNAGAISVQATGDVSISGGLIQSITWGSGKAGDIVVKAGTVRIDTGNISASAQTGSSGQTGFIKVEASKHITLGEGGSLSISNDATVANPGLLVPTKLTVSAPESPC